MEHQRRPQLQSFWCWDLPLWKKLPEEGIVNKVYSITYTQTETMERKWTNLKKKEDETFLKIIIGEEPIEAFDTFVEEWNAEGGAEITEKGR